MRQRSGRLGAGMRRWKRATPAVPVAISGLASATAAAEPDTVDTASVDASGDPRVSVVIPTHNRASQLDVALASVLASPLILSPAQVIVVDDDSRDGTPEVARRHGVRYVRVAAHSVARSRNAGWEQASTEYVTFLDDDDAWLPGNIEPQLAALDAQPDAGFAYGMAQCADEDLEPLDGTFPPPPLVSGHAPGPLHRPTTRSWAWSCSVATPSKRSTASTRASLRGGRRSHDPGGGTARDPRRRCRRDPVPPPSTIPPALRLLLAASRGSAMDATGRRRRMERCDLVQSVNKKVVLHALRGRRRRLRPRRSSLGRRGMRRPSNLGLAAPRRPSPPLPTHGVRVHTNHQRVAMTVTASATAQRRESRLRALLGTSTPIRYRSEPTVRISDTFVV